MPAAAYLAPPPGLASASDFSGMRQWLTEEKRREEEKIQEIGNKQAEEAYLLFLCAEMVTFDDRIG